MYDWLRHHDRVRLCLATKADKVGRSSWPAHLKQIVKDLGMNGITPPSGGADPSLEPILLFSSEEGIGKEDLWRWVTHVVRTDTKST